MSKASKALAEFHRTFDVSDEGGLAATCRRRMALHTEEHEELAEALDDLARSMVPERRELTEAVARELCDVLYVAYGTAELLGLDLDAGFKAVHEANMRKLPDCPNCAGTGCLGVIVAENEPEILSCGDCNGTGHGKPLRNEWGKVQKPKSWQPPNMSAAIRNGAA